MCSILKDARRPKTNLTKEQRRALKTLKGKDGIVILPADKGNTTVMMEDDQYEEKIRVHLETPVYRMIDTDPTSGIERKVTSELRELKRRGELEETTLTRIRPAKWFKIQNNWNWAKKR